MKDGILVQTMGGIGLIKQRTWMRGRNHIWRKRRRRATRIWRTGRKWSMEKENGVKISKKVSWGRKTGNRRKERNLKGPTTVSKVFS